MRRDSASGTGGGVPSRRLDSTFANCAQCPLRELCAAAPSPAPAMAAPQGHSMRAMRTMMADMKAKDPQGYAACEALARQRGYSTSGDLGTSTMMFIDGCLSGKQR